MLRNGIIVIMTWVLALGAFSAFLEAQIGQATLQGTVRDNTGAVIPSASVTLKNLGTTSVRSVTTDSSGDYVIADLEPAEYSLTVTFQGFKTFTISSLFLHTGEKSNVDAVLQIGATTQEVTVSAAVPLLSTSSAEVTQVVNPVMVAQIPLNGRKFWQLTQLTPGVSFIPLGEVAQFGGSAIRARAVNVTVNGLSAIWTGWSLDGANVTNFELAGTLLQPNVDAIQEFRVESANMHAQYGHTPTMINASLKSGTNQFHGDVFEFLRNEKLDARNFFLQSREALKRNQFGGAMGGPIVRDRAFFFGDYQGTRLRQGVVFNNVVPSLAERQGDFSELLRGANPKELINPLTRQPFPGNIVPPSVFSPQAKFLLDFLPESNVIQGATSRAIFANALAQDQDEGDIRVDLDLRASDRLMNRYSISDNREIDPNPFPALKATSLHSRVQDETLRWTHVFSPKWINTAQFAYYRSPFLFGGVLEGTDINNLGNIKIFDDPRAVPVKGFPTIDMAGLQGFQGSPSDQRPKFIEVRTWQYTDTVSYANGKHDVKIGMEWMHRLDAFSIGADSVGRFNFRGTFTRDAFADLLLGFPDSAGRRPFQTLQGNYDSFKAWFFQDDYRVTPNLVLNLGVRWEINPFFKGLRNTITGFDLGAGKVIIPAGTRSDLDAQPLLRDLLPLFRDRIVFTDEAGLPESIRPSDRKDLGPRLGLAWRPFGAQNTVVRAGYGIFYAYYDTNLANNTVVFVPFVASETLFNDRPPAVPRRTTGDFFLGQRIATPNPNPGQPCPFGFVAISCDTPGGTSGPVRPRYQYTQEWNFSIQRQITQRVSFDVAYIGTKTNRLQQFVPRNNPLPGPGEIQPRRPLPQFGPISIGEFGGKTHYHALQTKFETRDWHDLTLLGSYTYSRCLDNGSDEGSAPHAALIPFNLAPCDFDQTHSGVFSYSYALPFGHGKRYLSGLSRLANQLLVAGWEISGVTTLQSGLPFTPTIAGDRANTGTGGQRPDLVGAPLVPRTVSCWFFSSMNSNCRALFPSAQDAFVLPPRAARFGTSGRNILRAGNLTQFDFTILKNFPISESKHIQFRSEFFNIFNHAAFKAPSTTIDSSSGGQVSQTLNAPRLIEFALKFIF